jgi:hypothetical protein
MRQFRFYIYITVFLVILPHNLYDQCIYDEEQNYFQKLMSTFHTSELTVLKRSCIR